MKMRTRTSAGLAGLLLAVGTLSAEETPTNPNVDEAKGIIKHFADQLTSELKAAMNTGGPIQAIQVCNQRAPAIAAGLSQATGWDVGRTSLKLRNRELDTPDDWELRVLNAFESRKAAGEDVQTMAHAEVVETDQGKVFRFMKPIPTQELCLTCHGAQVADEVAAELDKYYPDDQARGFSEGDIRGAFTLSKPL